jgi:outer membrane protein TolC
MRRGVVSAALLWLCSSALGEPLPEPLTLEQALALGSASHPVLEAQYAQLGLAEAQRDEVSSQLGLEARFIADGRWVEPSTNDNATDADDSRFTSHNDSRLHLVVTKRLYDFGQSDARIAAANARAEVEALRLETLRGRHRLEVARSFLEVVLADLASAEAEEAMAIEYVRLDRLRQRNELKQVSDVEVARQDYRYQSRRVERYEAQARQRTRRARLAEVLDRPGELPDNVIPPELQDLDREVPDLSQWIDQALVANPTLKALRADAEAAREQMRAARYGNRPVLTGELQASDYEREFATRDRYRAALALEVPLYTGGRLDARRAAAIASAQRVDAELAQAQSEVRQALVEARERIGVLQVQREQAAAEMDYRDLNLDQARTLYDLEARADLGNNMADFSGSRLRLAQASYQLALTWAEVALLTGHAEWDVLAAGGQKAPASPGAASP